MTYFPFAEYWWLYLAFTGFVLALLALDLGVFHRRPHAISFREAALWSVVWIGLALAFNYALYQYTSWKFIHDPRFAGLPGFDPQSAARRLGLEFLAGYVVEKSLSLDNIFVFVLVFRFFATPARYQHRVLFYGILGALVFRAVFIALGSALLRYHWVILLFGAFLILTGLKMGFAPPRPIAPERNPLIRLLRRLLPVTPELDGKRLLTRRGGVWHATPLLLTLVFVEASDIVFAVDSVPAIFALTREPLIVFTSNVFAILGLRALYFLLAGAMDRFALLKYGLACVLVFVGLKMVWLNDAFGGTFPIGWSVGIIAAVLLLSITASLLLTKKATGAVPAAGIRPLSD